MGSDRKLRRVTKFLTKLDEITVKLVNCKLQKYKDNMMVVICLKYFN